MRSAVKRRKAFRRHQLLGRIAPYRASTKLLLRAHDGHIYVIDAEYRRDKRHSARTYTLSASRAQSRLAACASILSHADAIV